MEAYQGEAWLGQPPHIHEDEIIETATADIVVVGGGLAGVAAVRQAAEQGNSVILLEKCATIQGRSGDFAAMDSRAAKVWGRQEIDKARIVDELTRDMCYKVSQDILRRWADEAGAAFDWYLDGYGDVPVMKTTFEEKPQNAKVWLQPRRLPLPQGFDNEQEHFKCYQVTTWVQPTHIPLLRASFAKAEETGLVTAYFNAPACLLERKEGERVTGAIAKVEGGYLRAIARKGVILSTGDFMSDSAMLRRFAPGYVNTPQLWTSYDRNKKPSNTGDGHRLGMWIGAKMQDEPAAPCAHHMGSVFGCNGFVLLNTQGRRFTNEDLPGQQMGSQIENLPDKLAWQIVDSNWRTHVAQGYPSHGCVCYAFEDEQLESGQVSRALSTIDNVVTPALIRRAVEKGKLLQADTLEELLAQAHLPVETAMGELRRYNQMCHQGVDEDFAKAAKRLWPVEKGPFYAAPFTPATMIAVMGGLQSDVHARCYDIQGQVIPGLYVAGNVQGNRVAVDYPLTVPGLSHSLALTYGRIAAQSAAEGIS